MRGWFFLASLDQRGEQIEKRQKHHGDVLPVIHELRTGDEVDRQRYGGNSEQRRAHDAAASEVLAEQTEDARENAKQAAEDQEHRIGRHAERQLYGGFRQIVERKPDHAQRKHDVDPTHHHQEGCRAWFRLLLHGIDPLMFFRILAGYFDSVTACPKW
ncbi:hypothetical protein SDC9_140309 [bioreactor metagenome]|uniref:Uncharacterized protein n=1 Tax=bioreactor metagenome TaxID=1076179 RepID=A0A645DX40_9ZZZZ